VTQEFDSGGESLARSDQTEEFGESSIAAGYSEKQVDYFSTSRREIVDLIPPYSQRVLEVGCGDGSTLAFLRDQRLCGETVGIEVFPQAAGLARAHADRIFCLDVERDGLPADLGKFDLILILDVLEHLVDPWVVLEGLVSLHLAPGGTLLASIPNARHFSLVLPLILCGKFEYAERGILDRTHMRFFTRSSALAMMRGAGLDVQQVRSTSLSSRTRSRFLNRATLGLFSEFLSLQYLIVGAQSK
jgi:2-polyprenyl-3-methyl-5-hydroxy-6-metoxy-1,4-benzoquinol methylase